MRQFLGQITNGASVDEIYLAAEQLRANRNGQPYIQIELRDRSGGITGRMWNAGEQVFRTFEASRDSSACRARSRPPGAPCR